MLYAILSLLLLTPHIRCQNSLTDAVNEIYLNNSLYEEVTQPPLRSFGSLQACGESESTRGRFACVKYYNCDGATSTVVTEALETGFNITSIDLRFTTEENTCPHYLDVCCQLPDGGLNGEISSTTSSPPSTNQNTTSRSIRTTTSETTRTTTSRTTTLRSTRTTTGRSGTTTDRTSIHLSGSNSSQPKPQDNWSKCGIRNTDGIDFKLTGNTNNEYAEYGEFPWQIALLRTNYKKEVHGHECVCGGSLILPNVVLTAAHCVESFRSSPRELTARAGEWDSQTAEERIPHQDRIVSEVIVHESYGVGAVNDVALLVLERAFVKTKSVGLICLPKSSQVVSSGTCVATGWGKMKFGKEGELSVILKKIELPVVPNENCENMIKKTRLGPTFKLHPSFMCAGGEEGRDTCTGDGGSPLACVDPSNPKRYIQSGIVSWGIGCAQKEVPGVYSNVAKLRSWIDRQINRISRRRQ